MAISETKAIKLRILVGLLTCTLNRHLAIMRIQDDPTLPACGKQEETLLHFLRNVVPLCRQGSAAYTLQLDELCCISPSNQSLSELTVTLVTCALGQHQNGFSAVSSRSVIGAEGKVT